MSGAYLQNYTSYGYEISWMVITWGETGVFCDDLPLLFDVVSFSEPWLHDEISSNELLFPSFHPPERKDRADNRYGGVILYVKNNLSYIQRQDLELNNLECIWVQIKSSKKRNILYGVFYRPPNSDSVYISQIEDSIGLAIDSSISDVIITGDLYLNTMNQTQFRKVEALCNQFNMT